MTEVKGFEEVSYDELMDMQAGGWFDDFCNIVAGAIVTVVGVVVAAIPVVGTALSTALIGAGVSLITAGVVGLAKDIAHATLGALGYN